MFRWHVISAVFKRNLLSYFSGVLGYLFIVVFVTIGAIVAFSPEFFAKNQATLDQLSDKFPLLLLFLIPAITMGVWADERRSGTDELLFTLPVSDFEVLIGKYLSVLAVYSVALLFSITHVLRLAKIGSPDWGMLFSTYLGYWLAGAALLSAGMFASVLTRSTTVAFVLGTAICAVPVFLADIAPTWRLVRGLSLNEQLRDFTTGVIPLTGCFYFVSLTVFMLYLNAVMISKRHWSGGKQAAMGAQFLGRTIAVGVALISLNVLAVHSNAKVNTNLDLTSEGIYTLATATRDQIAQAASDEQAIDIQAFISPEVPQEYEYARKQLIGLLRQYARLGGKWISVRYVDTEPLSTEATEARSFGINPVSTRSEQGGRTIQQDVYLGVVVQSALGEVVVPFFQTDESMQYQLTRSIATVCQKERLKVGVLETDARVISEGMQTGGWIFDRMVNQLKQQYKVVSIKPSDLHEYLEDGEKKAKDEGKDDSDELDKKTKKERDKKNDEEEQKSIDVLIAVLPSSLTSSQLSALVDYVKAGKPALIFDDPWPFSPVNTLYPRIGTIYAPKQERPAPQTPAAFLSTAPDISPQLPPDFMQRMNQFRQFGPQFQQQMMEEHFAEHPEHRPRFEPKADGGKLTSLLSALDISWDNGTIVSDVFDPHPDFDPVPPPHLGTKWPTLFGAKDNFFLFIAPENGNPNALGTESPITRGLAEVVAFYAGEIRAPKKGKYKFTPLLQSSVNSVPLEWDEYSEDYAPKSTAQGFMSSEPKERVQKSPVTGHVMRRLKEITKRKDLDKKVYTIAAHISPDDDEKGPNVVFVADTDMISDMYFQQQEAIAKPLDNMTFVMNAIEVLAGTPEYAELRSLKPEARSLTAVQTETDAFRKKRREAQQTAEAEMEEKLKAAQVRLEEKAKNISKSEDLGIIQRAQLTAMSAETEQERFDAEKKKLKLELEQKIQEIKTTEQTKIREQENGIRFWSIVLPPIPALLLGIIFLGTRLMNERRDIAPNRRVG
ncbi:MAG: Gldg family protein [Planctomycetota bacterium]|nr:Gldg family protein [Planctomycetota bacterium]